MTDNFDMKPGQVFRVVVTQSTALFGESRAETTVRVPNADEPGE